MSDKKNIKPLGTKAYGSIPHLPLSRMGPGDHKCPDGQLDIVQNGRKGDIITFTEKLDGSCCSVIVDNGCIKAITKAGYEARTSPFEQHHLFAGWVDKNIDRFEFLKFMPNYRIVGEWLAQAHGTRYNLTHEPFSPFDIIDNEKNKRIPYNKFCEHILKTGLTPPKMFHEGPMKVNDAIKMLNEFGFHGAIDPVEGFVCRVETKGLFNFICKYVRPDKNDGCYLPEVSGKDAVWNYRP